MHITPFLTIYILVFSFILGSALGSFLDCMAWRMIHGESVLKGRSHCDACGHVLGVLDLFPILSYILLRGRCRYCGSKVPKEDLICEIIMGVAFSLAVYRFDISVEALRLMVLACILLALSIIDLHTYTIPDRFHIVGIALFLVTIPFMGEDWKTQLLQGLICAVAVSGSMLILSLIFDKVMGKESLGGGDIKLLFMTGLYMQPLVGLFNLILSCVIGLIFVLVLKKDKIPFGPSIAIASFLSILVGRTFIQWYINIL